MGLRTLDRLGVDDVMWASDYPHPDSTWPEAQKVVEEVSRELAVGDKERKGTERYRLPRALPCREVLRDASSFGPLCSHDPLGRILSAPLLARAPTSQRRAAADKRRMR